MARDDHVAKTNLDPFQPGEIEPHVRGRRHRVHGRQRQVLPMPRVSWICTSAGVPWSTLTVTASDVAIAVKVAPSTFDMAGGVMHAPSAKTVAQAAHAASHRAA
ncbi:MAG: hypothetical protein R2854_03125 [Caldilineaceae bacterium]